MQNSPSPNDDQPTGPAHPQGAAKPRPRVFTTAEVAELTGRRPVSIKLLAQRRHREGNPLGQKLGHIWVFDEDEVREIAGIPNRRGRPGREKKPSAEVDFSRLSSS